MHVGTHTNITFTHPVTIHTRVKFIYYGLTYVIKR